MADSQDNELEHTALSVEQCLTTKNMAVFPPSYLLGQFGSL
jgi:hypothetical protein